MHKKKNPVYVTHEPMTAPQILEKAAEILSEKFARKGLLNSSAQSREFLRFKLGAFEREVFAVLLLDTQLNLIEYKELFYGTIDCASVYPREVVKAVLEANASTVILAHNHPTGCTEPSMADKYITKRLVEALALIDVRVMDHIIIGDKSFSFADNHLL